MMEGESHGILLLLLLLISSVCRRIQEQFGDRLPCSAPASEFNKRLMIPPLIYWYKNDFDIKLRVPVCVCAETFVASCYSYSVMLIKVLNCVDK